MQKQCQAFLLVWLLCSGPSMAARINTKAAAMKAGKEKADVATAAASKWSWCNPFASQATRTYRFFVDWSNATEGQVCKDGACAAIELVRDWTDPLLKIHYSQQWNVADDDGEIEWSLGGVGLKESTEKEEGSTTTVKLLSVNQIHFNQAGVHNGKEGEYPEELSIELEDGKTLAVEGGFWMNPSMVAAGMQAEKSGDSVLSKKLMAEAEKVASNVVDAVNPFKVVSNVTTGALSGGLTGAKIGFAVPAAIFFVALVLPAIASLSLPAVAASMVIMAAGGVLGSASLAVVGAVAGGVLYAAGNAVLRLFGLGYEDKTPGHEIIPAGRKIFEKLRCMDAFQSCNDDTLVPATKRCPKKELFVGLP